MSYQNLYEMIQEGDIPIKHGVSIDASYNKKATEGVHQTIRANASCTDNFIQTLYNMEIQNQDTSNWCVVQDEEGKYYRVRIRKLTPKECFRLMGVRDDDSDKMLNAVSRSQAYKQAGNSIVVDNLFYLFESLWYPDEAAKRSLVSMAKMAKEYPTNIIKQALKAFKELFTKDAKKGKVVVKDISTLQDYAVEVEEDDPRQTSLFDLWE